MIPFGYSKAGALAGSRMIDWEVGGWMTSSQGNSVDALSKVSRRIPSLDGLRGIAALGVVFGHARLVILDNGPSDAFTLPVIREFVFLIGALGGHAVWLFFILSGLVLTRMMISAARFEYGNYLLGRLARLYIPVAGAVVFTFLTMLIVGRNIDGLGQWVDNHPNTYSPSSIIYDLTLISGSSGNLSPLWSLQWEVLFSLLLILYVAVIRKMPPLLAIVAALSLCVVGDAISSPVLMFLSMFAIGTGLAFGWDRMAASRDQLEIRMRRHMLLYGSAVILALAVTVAMQITPTLIAALDIPSRLMGVGSMIASMLGLTASIVLIGLAKPLRVIFEMRLIQWFGLISFSIYLVHEPILLAFTYLFDAAPVGVLAALVLAFPIAHVFYVAIEKPSHTLARRFSKRSPGAPVPTPSVSFQ